MSPTKFTHLTVTAFLFICISSCGLKPSTKKAEKGPLAILKETEGFSLKWQDQFDSFKKENWTIGLEDKATGNWVPGAAGKHFLNHSYDAYYTEEDVYVENGALVLRNQKRTINGSNPKGKFSYSSGWVMSMHKVFFTEGYLEVRAQFPKGDKVWPAIWLIPEDLSWCPEWDLFEYFGYRKNLGFDQMGMHLCHSPYPNQQWENHFVKEFDKAFNCEAWHTYGFAWTAEYAIWYIDGQEVRRLEAVGIKEWPKKDMYIVLNNGTRRESPDKTTSWPNYLKIDYIKLYTK